jgi:hypothetical protein
MLIAALLLQTAAPPVVIPPKLDTPNTPIITAELREQRLGEAAEARRRAEATKHPWRTWWRSLWR